MDLLFSHRKARLGEGLDGRGLFPSDEYNRNFGRPLRVNLSKMLDGLGLNVSCACPLVRDLFEHSSGLVQFHRPQ